MKILIYILEENIKRIELFSKLSGIRFIAEIPGYKYNKISLNLINSLESKWWPLDINMMNRRCKENMIKNQISVYLYPTTQWYLFILRFKPEDINTFIQTRKYIQYLYDKRLPIKFNTIKTSARMVNANTLIYTMMLNI